MFIPATTPISTISKRLVMSASALVLFLSACTDSRTIDAPELLPIPVPPLQQAPEKVAFFGASLGSDNGNAELSWEAVKEATSYNIMRCDLPLDGTTCDMLDSSTCGEIGTTEDLTYSDATAATDAVYCYGIQSCNGDSCSTTSDLRIGYGSTTSVATTEPSISIVGVGPDAGSNVPVLGFSNTVITPQVTIVNSTDPVNVLPETSWTASTASNVVIEQAHTQTPLVFLPDVTEPTEVPIDVTVTTINTNETLTATQPIIILPDTIIIKTTDTHVVADGSLGVRLHASAATDSGGVATYSWRQIYPESSQGTLTDANTGNPLFQPPVVTNNEDRYILEVTATDPTSGNITIEHVTVDVTRTDPEIDLGTDIVAYPGERVNISSRIINGIGPLDVSYRIENNVTDFETAKVTSQTGETVSSSFIAPDVTADTTLTVYANVESVNGRRAFDEVNVVVKPIPATFELQVSPPSSVFEGEHVNLTASVANGGAPTYSWAQTGGTAVAIENPTAAHAGFFAPDITGSETLTFEVTVTDGSTEQRATVAVDILDVPTPISVASPTGGTPSLVSSNAVLAPPMTVHASPHQLALSGDVVSLSASTSGATEPVIYTWSQIPGTTNAVLTPNGAEAQITAPTLGAKEKLVFQVLATDGDGDTSTDTTSVSVAPLPRPLVLTTFNELAIQNKAAQLSVKAGGGTPGYTYQWSPASGPGFTLSDANSANPTLTPTLIGDFNFTVSVTDASLFTQSEQITLKVAQDSSLPPLVGNIVSSETVVFSQGSSNLELEVTGGVPPYDIVWDLTSGPTAMLQVDPDDNEKAVISLPLVDNPNEVVDLEAEITDSNSNKFVANIRLPALQTTGPLVLQTSGSQVGVEGDTLPLTASVTGGRAPYTYAWTQEGLTPVTFSSTTDAAVSITLPDIAPTGEELTFRITVTDDLGETESETLNVLNVDVSTPDIPTPRLEAFHPFEINTFSGYEYTQHAAPYGGVAPYEYEWKKLPSDTVISTDQVLTRTAPTVTAKEVETFSLMITDNLGKSVTETRTVNINPVPATVPLNVKASVDNAHASGEKFSFSAVATGAVGAVDYDWKPVESSPLKGVDNTQNPKVEAPVVTAATTVKYEVVATDAAGRTATDVISVKISPAKKTTTAAQVFPAGIKANICEGGICGLIPELDAQTTCTTDKPLPYSYLENMADGSKKVTKGCATPDEAEFRWWQQSSDRSECTDFDPKQSYNYDFDCFYVCTKDFCNYDIFPKRPTLFKGRVN